MRTKERRPLVSSASAPALGATATAMLEAPAAYQSRGLERQLADEGLLKMLEKRGFVSTRSQLGSATGLLGRSQRLAETTARAERQFTLDEVPSTTPVRPVRASQQIPKTRAKTPQKKLTPGQLRRKQSMEKLAREDGREEEVSQRLALLFGDAQSAAVSQRHMAACRFDSLGILDKHTNAIRCVPWPFHYPHRISGLSPRSASHSLPLFPNQGRLAGPSAAAQARDGRRSQAQRRAPDCARPVA